MEKLGDSADSREWVSGRPEQIDVIAVTAPRAAFAYIRHI